MDFNKNKKCKDHGHNPIKHIFHMILCCGLPIVIILALPFIANFTPIGAGILGIIAPFICPLMMGGMVYMMFKNKKERSCDEIETKDSISEKSEK